MSKIDMSAMNGPQRQAVTHGEGALLLLAGPGSGKTFTITNRILYLLEQGVRPETILVITFTKEAALSMQNRFQKMSTASYPVNFGTFHSLFYHILQESKTLRSGNLLKNSEKKNLILPILSTYESLVKHDSLDTNDAFHIHADVSGYKSADSHENTRRYGYVSANEKYGADDKKQEQKNDSMQNSAGDLSDDALQILAAVSYYKNTLNMSAAADKVSQKWQPYFAEICQEYARAVKRTGQIDFDDMLYECMCLLRENESVRKYWQKRFRHILIDEFQDINPVQYEAVKLLTSSPYNIFAVGDDDQSIYGFRGSEPGCMKRFKEEFHARELLLDINYRSRAEIVEASLAVIEENQNRFVKALKAATPPDAPNSASQEKVPNAVPKKDASRVSSQKKVPYAVPQKETSGAASQKKDPNAVPKKDASGAASQENAPDTTARKDTSSAAYKQEPVSVQAFGEREEQYAHMIQAISECLKTDDTCAVLFRTNSYMQSFAARLKAADIPYEMREKAVSIYEHFIVADIMAYLQIAQGAANRGLMLRIINKPSRYISREAVGAGNGEISGMLAYYDRAQLPAGQKSSAKSELLRLERQLQNVKRLSLKLAVNYILKAVGYEQYLKELSGANPDKWKEWQELLEWLKEDAGVHSDLKEWKAFQENYTAEPSKPSGGKRAVQLLTAHGAKGLEYDRVWIPDCNEKVYPHGKMPDTDSVEEERRIFYVAMTRAKKCLELSYLAGTKDRPRQPSRFLNPLFER